MPNHKRDRTGEKYMNNEGYEMEIVECFGTGNCTIKFNDLKATIVKNAHYAAISRGSVCNPNHPSVCGIGYRGQGEYVAKINGKHTKTYSVWHSFINRCYNKQFIGVTYKDCTVDERWHNFQNFAKWFYENYSPETMQGWAMDKDILVKGNKIYSPETCAFIPQEINSLFTKRQNKRGNFPLGVRFARNNKTYEVQLTRGCKKFHLGTFKTVEEAFECYKFHKEKYIKEVAEKWRDQISEQVYQTLINYQVEITD